MISNEPELNTIGKNRGQSDIQGTYAAVLLVLPVVGPELNQLQQLSENEPRH